jgi:hypothetical protein
MRARWLAVALATFSYPVRARSEPVPLEYADFSWVPGNAGSAEKPWTVGPFAGEFRIDTVYNWSFANPKDDTVSGSGEVFRHGEFQVTQLGIGGDFFWQHVMGRVMTQLGLYSEGTPRNDASPSRGQWQLADAYRYLSEANAGYHFDVWCGINVQAGLFLSYLGTFSYYNFDNWTYQLSYLPSAATPWYMSGLRVQIFPSDKLKIEPWLVNGWQSYGRFNNAPGSGVQIAWRPESWVSFVASTYLGTDTLNVPKRMRLHTDDSVAIRYYDAPAGVLSKAAASLTVDAGCEAGGGVSCGSQYVLGFMIYNRLRLSEIVSASPSEVAR